MSSGLPGGLIKMRNYKKFVIVLVSILLFVFSLMCKNLNVPQKLTLGIFFIALVFWVSEIIPLYLTSFLILFLECVLLSKFGGLSYKKIVASFFSPILLLFLGGFVIALAMKTYRIEEWIAQGILKRVGNKPFSILLGFMVVTAFLSMWMSNTATTALMIAVALPLIKKLGKFRKALILGIPFSASLGGMGTPIGTPPNAIAIDTIRKVTNLTFAHWVIKTLPLVLIMILITSLILYILFPPEVKEIEFRFKEEITIKGKSLYVLIIVAFTVLMWLTSFLHKISSSIIAILPIILLFGLGFLKKEHFRQLEWDILILMGGGLSLGFAIKETKLASKIIEILGISNLSGFFIIVFFVLITGVLSNFMSNTSATALIMPIAISAVSSFNSSFIVTIAMAISLAASSALVFPISTPPNAIAYGSGYIKLKDMMKAGFIINLLSLLLILITSLTWWKLV